MDASLPADQSGLSDLQSMRRPSSRNSNGKGNESIGSSLGTFDYSNASFSESFLRQAGANMLAGLDEANPSPNRSLSSSPRYRTSSSPTWSPSPVPLQAKVEVVQIESEKPQADISADAPEEEDEEELASSSASLSASTARIDELEAALETKESQQAELHDVRATLAQLSTQYEELVAEADEKDAAMVELVRKLQGQLSARGGDRVAGLERELEEERRLREVERRDYEVRIQGLLSSATTSSSAANAAMDEIAFDSDDRMTGAVEQAKEQLRLTLEKDSEIRRAMEQRDLLAKVEELERQLASTSKVEATVEDRHDPDVQHQVDQLTSELDRRFEELTDLREELESALAEKEHAESRARALEEELDEARSRSHHDSRDSANKELDELRTTLVERDTHISRLEETLSLTTSRLTTLTANHDALQHQNILLSQSRTDDSTRIATLESHILSLETQLRTRTPNKATESTAEVESATPGQDRLAKLHKELASLQLDLVKLGKANDALQEDNVHFSIALSAKQLELGMVKRNARFALKNARAMAQGERVGLPLSKSVKEKEVEFPAAPKGEVVAERKEVDKENVVPVNQARLQARQMLALRKAAPVAGGDGGGGARRVRPMLAA
uniref:Uncharacterized protein n=1 Tax=Kalmanozyma brasiliensis (strain GHG001) TaxID=1365824 RepID=V5ESD0_KALBG